MLWLKVEGWYVQTPAENMMSAAKPLKAHVSDQSLKEAIVVSYYLLSPVKHNKLADLFSFHNDKNRV